MKTKTILIAALGLILGGGAIWFAPQQMLAQTNNVNSADQRIIYRCPMHPWVQGDKPGKCRICGMELQPVYYETGLPATNAPSSATNNDPVDDTKPKPYPLDTCIVDGMKLGSMGDSYVFVYQGQEVKFCCSGCKPIFLKDPDKYMKIIQDAEAAANK